MSSLFVFAILLSAGGHAQQPLLIDSTSGGRLAFDNGVIRVLLESRSGGYVEEYYAKADTWRLVLRSGSSLRPEPALKADGVIIPVAYTGAEITERTANRIAVVLRGSATGHTITKTIVLQGSDPFVRIRVQDNIPGTAELSYVLSTYSYVPDGKSYVDYRPLDFVWTPHLRPDSTDVIGDHSFRSPALMMQKGSLFAAMVPDVERISRWRNMVTSADVQVETAELPFMSYGAMNWRQRSHVLFTHSDGMTSLISDGQVSYGFYLYLNAKAQARRGFRDIVRFQWNQEGHKNFMLPRGPQSEPFSSYIRKAWKQYLPTVALDTTYNGHPVTLLRQQRLVWSNKLPPAADNDCWFTVWFNSLRTAYGMYLYGTQAADADVTNRALRVLALATDAPQHHGISPSIFYVDSSGGHWVADQGWGGIDGGRNYSAFNNEWTDYWLLQWSDVVPERRQEIITRVRAFADFLIANQRKSGVMPSWFDPVTLKPVETFLDENAETSGAALFLSELYARTHEEKYLKAAENAMSYVFTAILPENKWFDFETFFSCSRKPLSFYDRFTKQYPQNTLSMDQAAEACCTLYSLTGKQLYKEYGVSIMDYLCLYQQVWSPSWLSRELFGGFGVQNTDGEWSDSRQGYFAVTLMKYYELTGNEEYLERSIAALRSMFSLFESPSSPRTAENYAHSTEDRPGGVTGIHWGTGSSVVSIHLIRQRYGDAFVNVRDSWGVGIDGCRISAVTVDNETIRFSLLDNVASPRRVRVIFGEIPGSHYRVIVNGEMLGNFTTKELRGGIDVQI